MSQLPTPGFCIGEMNEEITRKGRNYTNKTNDNLAGDNASPFPRGDVACASFKAAPIERKIEPAEGIAFREAMADQGDEEGKLSLTRR